MTRRRGYLWLTALLAVLIITVLLWPMPTQVELTPIAGEQVADTCVNREFRQRNGEQKRRALGREFRRETRVERRESSIESREPWTPPVRKQRTIVRLNSADSLDLVQLYNIGPVMARRILQYRQRLGGFVSVEQLKEVYGMDSVRYYDILPYVVLDSMVPQQLDLNTATIDQLKRHPYLDYYQAKAIVRLREQRGPYHTPEELAMIAIIDTDTYNKILPYTLCSSPQNR